MKKDLKEYDEMIKITREFYNSLNIEISNDHIDEAVISLTMPKYFEEFNKKKSNIKNNILLKNHHGALSTVGDAVCEAYWMKEKYKISSTQEELTDEKKALTNKHLNIIGEKLLKDKLFATNSDLTNSNPNKNKKSYATAFEAVIGFISLIRPDEVSKILDENLKKE